jgi:hypothetical protein
MSQVKEEPMDDVECHRDVIKTEAGTKDDVTMSRGDDVEEPTDKLGFEDTDIDIVSKVNIFIFYNFLDRLSYLHFLNT